MRVFGANFLAQWLLYSRHRKVYFDNTEGQLKDIGTNKGRYKSGSIGTGAGNK
jgi:hypothetical protein